MPAPTATITKVRSSRPTPRHRSPRAARLTLLSRTTGAPSASAIGVRKSKGSGWSMLVANRTVPPSLPTTPGTETVTANSLGGEVLAARSALRASSPACATMAGPPGRPVGSRSSARGRPRTSATATRRLLPPMSSARTVPASGDTSNRAADRPGEPVRRPVSCTKPSRSRCWTALKTVGRERSQAAATSGRVTASLCVSRKSRTRCLLDGRGSNSIPFLPLDAPDSALDSRSIRKADCLINARFPSKWSALMTETPARPGHPLFTPSRRGLLALGGAAGVAGLLSACGIGGGDTEGSAGSGSGNIRALFMKQAGYSEENINEMISSFQAANKGRQGHGRLRLLRGAARQDRRRGTCRNVRRRADAT